MESLGIDAMSFLLHAYMMNKKKKKIQMVKIIKGQMSSNIST